MTTTTALAAKLGLKVTTRPVRLPAFLAGVDQHRDIPGDNPLRSQPATAAYIASTYSEPLDHPVWLTRGNGHLTAILSFPYRDHACDALGPNVTRIELRQSEYGHGTRSYLWVRKRDEAAFRAVLAHDEIVVPR